MKKVVLAYSGGLDTSVAIPWLTEAGYEVIAVAVDVGQSGDLSAAVDRGSSLGAIEARKVDARERYVNEFVLPALAANALYQHRYPLISALSRPLIAQVLVDVAEETGADAVAHGCTGKGNDQVRFETSLSALAPDIEVLAPVRDWGMNRDETIEFALERDLPIETTKKSPYSIDENLWGRSIECGVLEDPWTSPPEEIYELTKVDPQASEVEVVVGFEEGAPTSLDGERLSTEEVIRRLSSLAGSFGFGRVDLIEDRLVGIKSREIYEAPGALALIGAHRDLESLTVERLVAREKRRLEATWAELVYEGLWFSPLREAIDAFIATTQVDVSGEVRLKLEPGMCSVVGRRSERSLYDYALATYDEEDAFDHSEAAGFIGLWSMPTKQWSRVKRRLS